MAERIKLVFATRNRGKLSELKRLLADQADRFELLTLDEVSVPEVVEDGATFVANAKKKALEIARHTGLPALADDSGLAVDALDGQPGVHSARFAGDPCDDERNNDKLLAALAEVPDSQRSARFHSVLALADTQGKLGDEVLLASGECQGQVLRERRGTGGFGYDPLFFVPEIDKTFAEMTADDKNRVSHRARAMRELRPKLLAYFEQALS